MDNLDLRSLIFAVAIGVFVIGFVWPGINRRFGRKPHAHRSRFHNFLLHISERLYGVAFALVAFIVAEAVAFGIIFAMAHAYSWLNSAS
jgi:flagellar biosynthesis protein FliR